MASSEIIRPPRTFTAVLLVACVRWPTRFAVRDRRSDFDPRSTYLVQLRPAAPFPAECPRARSTS